MLPALLEVPTNADEWGRWAFNNQDQIQLIQKAIFKKYNVTLTPYIIFPINLEAPQIFLQNNQSCHTDFNAVLGLQSHDIQEVDFNDPDLVESWVNLVYQELFDASSALEI